MLTFAYKSSKSTAVESENLHYWKHENGLHEFQFANKSKTALREWLLLFERIYRHENNNPPLPILADLRQSGMLPLRPLIHGINDIVDNTPGRPTVLAAIVTSNSDFTIKVFQTLLNTIVRRSEPVFYSNNYPAAMTHIAEKLEMKKAPTR